MWMGGEDDLRRQRNIGMVSGASVVEFDVERPSQLRVVTVAVEWEMKSKPLRRLSGTAGFCVVKSTR